MFNNYVDAYGRSSLSSKKKKTQKIYIWLLQKGYSWIYWLKCQSLLWNMIVKKEH